MKFNVFDVFVLVVTVSALTLLYGINYLSENNVPHPKDLRELVENCEMHLPKNQYCEIQITAVVLNYE